MRTNIFGGVQHVGPMIDAPEVIFGTCSSSRVYDAGYLSKEADASAPSGAERKTYRIDIIGRKDKTPS